MSQPLFTTDYAQWRSLFDYVSTLPVGATVSLDEVAKCVNDGISNPDRHINREQAQQVIGIMNDKEDAVDAGIFLVSVQGGTGTYKVASPSEVLRNATITIPRKLVNQARKGKKRLTAVTNHPDATDHDKQVAANSLAHYGNVETQLKEHRRVQRKLAPERPKPVDNSAPIPKPYWVTDGS